MIALSDEVIEAAGVEFVWEFRSVTSLDAVDRPEDLLEAAEIDGLADFLPRMVAGKAAVVGRVPVLGGDDEVVFGHQFVDDGNDLITLRNGEAAAGEEVVLEVDDEERFHDW